MRFISLNIWVVILPLHKCVTALKMKNFLNSIFYIDEYKIVNVITTNGSNVRNYNNIAQPLETETII